MTASPGHSYEHDILGNRTWRNPFSSTTVKYVWDDAGRLAKAAGPSNGATYSYRADGMRTKKVTGLSLAYIEDPESETSSGFYDEYQAVNHPTWRYRYDGQMCVEEDFTTVDGTTLTQTGTSYALGARGIDMLQLYSVNTSNWTRTYDAPHFPIYDGHGNMTATLSRSSSSPYYAIANERTYDVWGGVRSGASSGDPNTRYCANLGHKQDDESGLIYMRARYYEPAAGRFVSEDRAREGWNFYAYCKNDPVSRVDYSGNNSLWDNLLTLAHTSYTALQLIGLVKFSLQSKAAAVMALAGLLFLSAWFGDKAYGDGSYNFQTAITQGTLSLSFIFIYGLILESIDAPESPSAGVKAIGVIANYAIILSLFIRLAIFTDDF